MTQPFFTIQSITIVRKRNAADAVILNTDLKPSVYPFKEPPPLQFDVAHGGAEDYVESCFPDIPFKVIELY